MASCRILRLSCKEYGNFSIVKENAVLQGSVLTTFAKATTAECEVKCLFNEQCNSINVEKGDKTCELNGKSVADYGIGEKQLVTKNNWVYKSTSYNDIQVSISIPFAQEAIFDMV